MSQPPPPDRPSPGPGHTPLPLPAWLEQRGDGLYALPNRGARADDVARFADRLFVGGDRFAGLDYAAFLGLLYPPDDAAPTGPIRLASAVVPFPEVRRALYKEVRLDADGATAEYLFEPVALEVVEPDAGDAGSGEAQPRLLPTRLDVDEFVAAMWLKGVRFGLDIDAFHACIERGGTARQAIAHMRPPVPGCDAGIREVSDALHRDDTPKVRADGRHELSQFANRYPQVAAGAALLKKVPRTVGRYGVAVTGRALDPGPLPKDLDLEAMAGPGTRVERRDDGDYLVSAQDGFLSLDIASNQVSVTEKVVNREGISLRTTGDLKLSGDEFETHGDVQEGRTVEGRHMTFHGDVFGTLVSKGGNIVIGGNLVGGKATSPRGSVVIEGRASQATVEAEGGEVRIRQAEGCTIVGGRVRIERAVNCEIIAEAVEAEGLESCAVAARTLHIGVTTTRKAVENLLSVLVPDLSPFRRRRQQLGDEQAAAARTLAARNREREGLKGAAELAKVLALEARLRTGEIRLTPAQQEQLQVALRRYAPVLRELRALDAEIRRLREEGGRLRQERDALGEREAAAWRGVACAIERVAGETLVRGLPLPTSDLGLDPALIKAIRSRLRQFDKGLQPLFSGDDGSLDWHYRPEPH